MRTYEDKRRINLMNENFSYKMKLTDEEKDILHGSKGVVMA